MAGRSAAPICHAPTTMPSRHPSADVFRGELVLQMRPQRRHACAPKIIVEIALYRRQDPWVDPGIPCPLGQSAHRRIPCRIGIAQDIEPRKAGREPDGAEMPCRQRRHSRKAGQSLPDRQHGFDPFAHRKDVLRHTEPHPVANRTPLPKRCPMARRDGTMGALSCPSRASQVRCAPVIAPLGSVTAAIIAGHSSVAPPPSGRQ